MYSDSLTTKHHHQPYNTILLTEKIFNIRQDLGKVQISPIEQKWKSHREATAAPGANNRGQLPLVILSLPM